MSLKGTCPRHDCWLVSAIFGQYVWNGHYKSVMGHTPVIIGIINNPLCCLSGLDVKTSDSGMRGGVLGSKAHSANNQHMKSQTLVKLVM